MKLERISIRNFRLLRDVSLDMAKNGPTTILVGPNNSGKTSVMDALRLFLGTGLSDRRKFTIHDLSHARHSAIRCLGKRLQSATGDDARLSLLRSRSPVMRMDLLFSHSDEPPDLAVSGDLMMDLDPTNKNVGLRVVCALKDAKRLLTDYNSRRDENETLFDLLSGDFSSYYGLGFYKIRSDGKEVETLDEGEKIVRRLIRVDLVPAQRYLDDEESSRSARLSKLLHEHYQTYYKLDNETGYQSLEAYIKEISKELTGKYDKAFDRLYKRLKGFGYPQGHNSPGLRIRAEMSSETFYKDNTRIFYESQSIDEDADDARFELPERYNGLGYKNLIFMILQLESFRAALDAMKESRARVHIIAIEEPEAHLHPQMQCVFVKEIGKAVLGAGGISTQVILSTHSSHMVADSGFDPVRYFRRGPQHARICDLSKELSPESDEARFLQRYMKLTHCDLFFADKAILVEGQVERLLLPIVMAQYADKPGCRELGGQYITILEVGGAYAHVFRSLIGFLGVPTLVITDIDSVGTDGSKCKVDQGVSTSNQTLKTWLPKKTALEDIHAATPEDRTDGIVRVAYQIAEEGYCGRSFEEAFIYANHAWLTENHAKLLATGALVRGTLDSPEGTA